MTIHRSINTLPVGCFAEIMHSISIGNPDYTFMLKRDNYYEPFEGEIPNGLDTIFFEMFYEFGEQESNNKLYREVAKLALLQNMFAATKQKTLITQIEMQGKKIEHELSRKEPFNKTLFFDSIASIQINLGVNIDMFKTSVREYLSYKKEVERRIKQQKIRRNG